MTTFRYFHRADLIEVLEDFLEPSYRQRAIASQDGYDLLGEQMEILEDWNFLNPRAKPSDLIGRSLRDEQEFEVVTALGAAINEWYDNAPLQSTSEEMFALPMYPVVVELARAALKLLSQNDARDPPLYELNGEAKHIEHWRKRP